jgi:hypothetical protein
MSGREALERAPCPACGRPVVFTSYVRMDIALSEYRHPTPVRRPEQALTHPPRLLLALAQVLADEVVELGRAHRVLERLAAAQGAEELVGAEQVLVVEHDVVDADDLVFS